MKKLLTIVAGLISLLSISTASAYSSYNLNSIDGLDYWDQQTLERKLENNQRDLEKKFDRKLKNLESELSDDIYIPDYTIRSDTISLMFSLRKIGMKACLSESNAHIVDSDGYYYCECDEKFYWDEKDLYCKESTSVIDVSNRIQTLSTDPNALWSKNSHKDNNFKWRCDDGYVWDLKFYFCKSLNPCGNNEYFENNLCYCKEGYARNDNGACLTFNELCNQKYSDSYSNSHDNEGFYCACKEGYSWNESIAQCLRCGENQYLGFDDECHCSDSYTWNDEKTGCVMKTVEVVEVVEEKISKKNFWSWLINLFFK